MTQTPAASLKTAAVVTGLKPWSRDWVMEGSENPLAREAGPQKTLFGEGSKPEGASELAELVRKAEAALSQTESEIAAVAGKPAQAAGVAAPAGLAALVAGGSRGDSESVDRGKGQIKQANVLQQMQDQQGLQPALSGLNGEMLAVSDAGLGEAVPAAAQPAQLSGAEFMSALGAARGKAGARGGEEQQSQSNLSDRGFQGKPALRTIEGGRKPVNLEGRDDYALLSALGPQGRERMGPTIVAPTELNARVTQGAMTRNRLTSEALLNMSNGIREFVGSKGGEMRVRLKPDNLGELNLRVQTRGNDVRLQIQASDESARKILEESLPHLKDKLASQNLQLGRVEVTVADSHKADHGQNQNQNQQHGNFQQHSMNDWMGQDSRNGQGGRSAWSDSESGWDARPQAARSSARAGVSALSAASGGARSTASESGRLDVRA
jgi:flagellar hook-length control protein FliK